MESITVSDLQVTGREIINAVREFAKDPVVINVGGTEGFKLGQKSRYFLRDLVITVDNQEDVIYLNVIYYSVTISRCVWKKLVCGFLHVQEERDGAIIAFKDSLEKTLK